MGMRIERGKAVRKNLKFFRLAYGVQDPYKVLVDGTFLVTAMRTKYGIKEQLPKMLNNKNVTPMTTGCVIAELRSLGDQGQGAAINAKNFYRLKCEHVDSPVGAAKCILDQIGSENSRKFMVATQDYTLQQALRDTPGVPLIRMNHQVALLEDPSPASHWKQDAAEKRRLEASAWEKKKLPELRETEQKAKLNALVQAQGKVKKKGPKGANPMSCMKGKKKQKEGAGAKTVAPVPATAAPLAESKPKRVRSRKFGTRTREEAERIAATQTGERVTVGEAEAVRGGGEVAAVQKAKAGVSERKKKRKRKA